MVGEFDLTELTAFAASVEHRFLPLAV
jgi:hypothetical protein